MATVETITRHALSKRASILRERLLSSPYEIDIERARYYTDSWKKTEGEPPCMRAMLALREILQRMTVTIDDTELLAGAKTAKRLASYLPVERGEFNTVLELELNRLLSREHHRFYLTESEQRELQKEILPFWKGKTVRSRKAELWKNNDIYAPMMLGPVSLYRIIKGAGVRNTGKILYLTIGRSFKAIPKVLKMQRELAALRPNLALTVFDVQGHFVPGFKRVLEMGFNGIAEKARQELVKLKPGDEDYDYRKDFYESILIATEAVSDYSNRYADLALELAESAADERKAELLEIAERCRRVPEETPRSFMEALQSMWMTQVVQSISYGMAGVLSPGRVDRYLYPYYKSDLDAGLITRDRALEAIEEYLIKLGTELILLIEAGKETASEMGVGSNTITIGGTDRQGNCDVNDVTHLFLEAHNNVKALANNLSVRISPDTPDDFLLKACESHRFTSGIALFNDELIVKELVNDGFLLEDARDYSIIGCVEPTSTGNCVACTAGNDLSLAGVLEMTLNEGRMLFAGKRIGAATPDPRTFDSFEAVKNAFLEQLSYNVNTMVRSIEFLDEAYAEGFPSPLVSSAIEGCLESGKDLTRGGAVYNYGSVTGRGLGTVANSLAAIRYAVFDEKIITMKELIRLLRSNFRGAEPTRQKLLHHAPKYGNDDVRADEIAQWITQVFCDEVRKYPCGRGGFYRPGIFSYGVHVVDGLYLGATPDGRLATEPVSNGISPVNGTELKGPTATLLSAARAGSTPLHNGTALNMRFSPRLFASDETLEKLAQLVSGYFDMDGRHVQFNVVDTDTLKDAQAHPERYRDLVVRVSGYCAYFTDLGKSIQDDIIARTNFENL